MEKKERKEVPITQDLMKELVDACKIMKKSKMKELLLNILKVIEENDAKEVLIFRNDMLPKGQCMLTVGTGEAQIFKPFETEKMSRDTPFSMIKTSSV